MSIDNKPDEVSVVYTNGDGRAWSAMLRAYGDNQLLGLTAEEAGELAGLDGAAPTSKRNSDLIRMGYIEPLVTTDGMNITRTNRSGRPAKVCTITLTGRIKLAELRRSRNADERVG